MATLSRRMENRPRSQPNRSYLICWRGDGPNSGKLYSVTGMTFTRHTPCAQMDCPDRGRCLNPGTPRSRNSVEHDSTTGKIDSLQIQQAKTSFFLGHLRIGCLRQHSAL